MPRKTVARLLLTLLLLLSSVIPLFGQSVPAPASQQLPPGEWQVLSQDGYIIYHEGADQSAANDLLELFQRFDDDFAQKLGVERPHSMRVFIAPNEGRFRLLTSGMPHWTGGLAKPSQRLIILQSPRIMPSRGQFSVTALHELVHILTEHKRAGYLPRWFSEGLAMYLSGETMYKNRTSLGRAVVFKKTYTLDGINDMMRLGPEQARVAYLQSISFIEFLVDHYGWESVAALLHGYQAGLDPNDVFLDQVGRSFYDIEVAYHQDLADQYRWFNILAWLNFSNLLWSGASILVMVVGMSAIIRRRRELHSGDGERIDESLADPRLYEDNPLWDEEDDASPAEYYEGEDEPWKK